MPSAKSSARAEPKQTKLELGTLAMSIPFAVALLVASAMTTLTKTCWQKMGKAQRESWQEALAQTSWQMASLIIYASMSQSTSTWTQDPIIQ